MCAVEVRFYSYLMQLKYASILICVCVPYFNV